MLHCEAIGDPKPTTKWDKNFIYLLNNETSDTRFKVFENGTLLIKKVHLDDEGLYGCTIGNSAGFKRQVIELYVNGTEVANVSSAIESDSFITRTVVLSVSVSLFYIFCVIALMIWCRHRKSQRRDRDGSKPQQSDDALMGEEDENGEKDECLIEKSEKSSSKKLNSDNSRSKNSEDNKSRVSNKTVAIVVRNDLTESHKLGRGVFGDVLIMKLNMASENEKRKSSRLSLNDPDEIQSLESGATEKMVMVRLLQKGKSSDLDGEFKRQMDMFASISHENVAKLFGLCDEKDFYGMILEWTDWVSIIFISELK